MFLLRLIVATVAVGEAFERKEADIEDGLDALSLFSRGQGFTYDDIILLPGTLAVACCALSASSHARPAVCAKHRVTGHIDFAVEEVELETALTTNIKLKLPMVCLTSYDCPLPHLCAQRPHRIPKRAPC